jgi:hypothetical protein
MRAPSFALVLILAACSAGGGGGGGNPDDTQSLKVFPTLLYTGVDESGAQFTAPIAAMGDTNLNWTTADTDIIQLSGDDSGATVRGLMLGHADITVTSKSGQMATVSVTVRSYPAGAKEMGQAGFERIGCARGGCHDTNGPDVTPSGIGQFDDLPIDTWVTQGKSLLDGHTIMFHMWDLMIPERMGIVAFLRSQPARGRPVAGQFR